MWFLARLCVYHQSVLCSVGLASVTYKRKRPTQIPQKTSTSVMDDQHFPKSTHPEVEFWVSLWRPDDLWIFYFIIICKLAFDLIASAPCMLLGLCLFCQCGLCFFSLLNCYQLINVTIKSWRNTLKMSKMHSIYFNVITNIFSKTQK